MYAAASASIDAVVTVLSVRLPICSIISRTGVGNASRRIYTGQFQQDNAATDPTLIAGKFRDEICKSIVALISCDKIEGPEALAIVRRIVATLPAMLNTLTTVRPGDSVSYVSKLCNWSVPERIAKPAA